jgi:hypothetical protein
MTPFDPTRTMTGVTHHPRRALALPVVAIVASGAAMTMLARQSDAATLDYDVGVVPGAAPWLAAGLSIVTAVACLGGRRLSSSVWSLLLGGLVLVTAWSVVIVPFDALRAVGLAPPLNPWGAATRLLLLVGSACALVAGQRARRVGQARCAVCRRVLPGRLDRLPRWPVGLAVAAALVYPALRLVWALRGTFGTAGAPLEMDAAVAWSPVGAGAAFVAFTVILFVGRGPTRARAVFGLGGVLAGLLLAMAGGLGALRAASDLASGVTQPAGEHDLMTWTFVVVYGSWLVAGLGTMVGGWRYWSHRRDACAGCRMLMGTS